MLGADSQLPAHIAALAEVDDAHGVEVGAELVPADVLLQAVGLGGVDFDEPAVVDSARTRT